MIQDLTQKDFLYGKGTQRLSSYLKGVLGYRMFSVLPATAVL